jgi:hypothetical protein
VAHRLPISTIDTQTNPSRTEEELASGISAIGKTSRYGIDIERKGSLCQKTDVRPSKLFHPSSATSAFFSPSPNALPNSHAHPPQGTPGSSFPGTNEPHLHLLTVCLTHLRRATCTPGPTLYCTSPCSVLLPRLCSGFGLVAVESAELQ